MKVQNVEIIKEEAAIRGSEWHLKVTYCDDRGHTMHVTGPLMLRDNPCVKANCSRSLNSCTVAVSDSFLLTDCEFGGDLEVVKQVELL